MIDIIFSAFVYILTTTINFGKALLTVINVIIEMYYFELFLIISILSIIMAVKALRKRKFEE